VSKQFYDERKKRVCFSTLGSHLMVSCPVLVCLGAFGQCCVHISFKPHQSLFGGGPRPISLQGPRPACLAPGFRWQCSHLFKWTALTEQSHRA